MTRTGLNPYTRAWLTGAGGLLAGLVLTAAAHAQNRHPTVLAPSAIDWAAVANDIGDTDKINQSLGFLLQQRAFDATTLPVILPSAGSGISMRQMTFSSFGDAYGMQLPQEQSRSDVTIVVTATRSFAAADPGTLDPADFEMVTVGGHEVPAQILDTESGWTASFPLYGALYSIDVDCGEQGPGSPCADPGFIRRVVSGFGNVTTGRTGQQAIAALKPPEPADDRGAPWRRVSADPAPFGPEDRYSDRHRWGDQRPDPKDEVKPRPDDRPPVVDTPPVEKPPVEKPPVEKPPVDKPPVVTPPRETPQTPEPPAPPVTPPATAKGDTKAQNPFFDWLLRQVPKAAAKPNAVTS